MYISRNHINILKYGIFSVNDLFVTVQDMFRIRKTIKYNDFKDYIFFGSDDRPVN